MPKKDGSWCIIMDLSSPHGSSINDFISKDDYTIHYASFDEALTLVALVTTNYYYTVLVTHIVGTYNSIADSLSRLQITRFHRLPQQQIQNKLRFAHQQ